MQRSSQSDKSVFNGHEYIKGLVIEKTLDYINRVFNINVDNPGELKTFFDNIEKELRLVATFRKFLIFNTNVITNNYARVLGDDTIRNFYLELITGIRTQICLEHDDKLFQEIVYSFMTSLERQLFIASDSTQSMVETGNDLKKFAGELKIKSADVKHFLSQNEWYFGIVLCNFFAADLLTQFSVLRSTKTDSPSK